MQTNNYLFTMTAIPLECVSEIFSYLQDGGGTILPQFKTEKPHIKEYLNTFCMHYSSCNIKYFNRQRTRVESRTAQRVRLGLPIKFSSPTLPVESSRHQCCGLTKRGHRCRNKTFGLFCERHEGSNTCYWTFESSKTPATQNISLEDFHTKGLQEAEDELFNLVDYPSS